MPNLRRLFARFGTRGLLAGRVPRHLAVLGAALLLVFLALGTWRAIDPLRVFASLSRDQRIVRLREPILAAALQSGLDPYLLSGLVLAESSGHPRAKSPAGALGLTQLMLSTAAEQARLMKLPEPSRSDLLERPELNLRLGAGYLARLIKRQGGSAEQALMAYNTGPTRFNRWLKEAGGFEAWLALRAAEGPPKPGQVLHYAKQVQAYAEEIRTKGLLEPPAP